MLLIFFKRSKTTQQSVAEYDSVFVSEFIGRRLLRKRFCDQWHPS